MSDSDARDARPRPQDPRLGRVYRRDPRNADYPLRTRVQGLALRGRGWQLAGGLLAQPQKRGSCTGHSAALDLKCVPGPLSVSWPLTVHATPGDVRVADDYALAEAIYEEARRQDEWDGEDYDGSSVLGASRAVVALGWQGEYRWAGEGGASIIDDVLLALSHVGPVVFGTDWLEAMFDPGPGGLLDVSGSLAGGHAYCCRGVILSDSGKRNRLGRTVALRDEPLLYGPQSWGKDWGRDGEWAMWASDAERLLKGGPSGYPGEARVTTKAFRRT